MLLEWSHILRFSVNAQVCIQVLLLLSIMKMVITVDDMKMVMTIDDAVILTG